MLPNAMVVFAIHLQIILTVVELLKKKKPQHLSLVRVSYHPGFFVSLWDNYKILIFCIYYRTLLSVSIRKIVLMF